MIRCCRVQWRIQGVVRPRSPPPCLTPNFLIIFALFLYASFCDWTAKSVSQDFCLLETASMLSFWDKNDSPPHTLPPRRLRRLAPPYWNPKYATGRVFINVHVGHDKQVMWLRNDLKVFLCLAGTPCPPPKKNCCIFPSPVIRPHPVRILAQELRIVVGMVKNKPSPHWFSFRSASLGNCFHAFTNNL